MPRNNGGILGPANNPSSAVATGVWSLSEATLAVRQSLWPSGVGPFDPLFKSVTLLLPGNGTNGANNNTFLDSSASNNTITRNGDTTQGTFGPFSPTGWSLGFPGDSNGMLEGPPTLFNSIPSTFTMEAFVYLTAYSSNSNTVYNSCIFGKGATYMNFGVTYQGKLQLYHYNGTPYSPASSGTVPLNQWVHVAVDVNGGAITFYINGQASGTGTWNGHTGNNTTPNIGGTSDANAGTDSRWRGFISCARYVTARVYTGNFTPPTTPLTAIANTQLLVGHTYNYIDGSPNAYAIGAFPSVKVQSFSPFAPTVEWSATTHGGSGWFDGSGDNLTLASSVWTALGGTSTSFTVEAWVYINARNWQPSEICGINQSGRGDAVSFTVTGDNSGSAGRLTFGDWSGGSSYTYTESAAGAVPIGAWTHVAASKSGSTIRLFVNGVQVTSNTITNATITGFTSMNVGGRSDDGATKMNGFIKDLRITNAALYTGNFTPPTSRLTTTVSSGTVTLLLNFNNIGVLDASGKHDFVTVGDAKISTAQSKWGGGSIVFDGAGDYLERSNTPLLNFRTGDFTVEMWLYRVNTANQSLFAQFNGGLHLYVNASSQLVVAQDAVSDIVTSSSSISANTWTHVAVARSGTSLKAFFDGVQVISVTSSVDFNGTGLARIGYGNGGWPLAGYVDDLRVSLGVARYTANFTPPDAFALR